MRELGRGSFGAVWLARRKADGQLLAVKTISLPPLASRDERAVAERRQALREVEILRTLASPYVVRYEEAILVPTTAEQQRTELHILTEYCDAGDLATHLRSPAVVRRGGLAEADVWSFAAAIVAGLLELHRLRILHRDLKPANVFLKRGRDASASARKAGGVKAAPGRRRGPTAAVAARLRAAANGVTGGTSTPRALVGDLGLARTVTGSQPLASTMVGTPHYTAPEIFEGEPYGKKADIYSFGVCVYELMHGKPPHAEVQNIAALAIRVLRLNEEGGGGGGGSEDGASGGGESSASELPMDSQRFSPELRALVSACLSRSPTARPSADEILLRIPERHRVLVGTFSATPKEVAAADTDGGAGSPAPAAHWVCERKASAADLLLSSGEAGSSGGGSPDDAPPDDVASDEVAPAAALGPAPALAAPRGGTFSFWPVARGEVAKPIAEAPPATAPSMSPGRRSQPTSGCGDPRALAAAEAASPRARAPTTADCAASGSEGLTEPDAQGEAPAAAAGTLDETLLPAALAAALRGSPSGSPGGEESLSPAAGGGADVSDVATDCTAEVADPTFAATATSSASPSRDSVEVLEVAAEGTGQIGMSGTPAAGSCGAPEVSPEDLEIFLDSGATTLRSADGVMHHASPSDCGHCERFLREKRCAPGGGGAAARKPGARQKAGRELMNYVGRAQECWSRWRRERLAVKRDGAEQPGRDVPRRRPLSGGARRGPGAGAARATGSPPPPEGTALEPEPEPERCVLEVRGVAPPRTPKGARHIGRV